MTFKQKFSELNPCIYAGKVPCSGCTVLINTDECDMKIGRNLHQDMFVAGAKYGLMLSDILDGMGAL